jgi:hypothetical protein
VSQAKDKEKPTGETGPVQVPARTQGFPEFLDLFTKSFAAVAACALVFSLAHDAGYFSTIGWQLMPLMSPTDYLRNTVLWLPLTLLLLVASVFLSSLIPIAKPRQKRTHPSTPLIVTLLAFATLFALYEYLVGTGIGLGYFVAAYAYWVVGFFLLLDIKGEVRPWVQWVVIIGLMGPIMLAVPLSLGKLSALYDLNFSLTYTVTVAGEKNRVEKQAVLLRVLDRGFLLYIPSSTNIIFVKNEQVLSINRSSEEDSRSRACRWFSWGCSN